MSKEIWKDIPGFEKEYQVSDLGRVKSLSRKMWNGVGFWTSKEKILHQYHSGFGYYWITLRINKKPKNYWVHRLVLYGFYGIKSDLECNHINGNKKDNRLENLEYTTASENVRHAWNTGLVSEEAKQRISEANLNKKVSEETKEKRSTSLKKYYVSMTPEERKEKHGKIPSKETRKKKSESMKKYYTSLTLEEREEYSKKRRHKNNRI